MRPIFIRKGTCVYEKRPVFMKLMYTRQRHMHACKEIYFLESHRRPRVHRMAMLCTYEKRPIYTRKETYVYTRKEIYIYTK